MSTTKWQGVFLSLGLGSALLLAGCDARPVTSPPPKKTNVDVKVGGGEGVKVDVDADKPGVPGKKADVDVDVGRDGAKVDVNK